MRDESKLCVKCRWCRMSQMGQYICVKVADEVVRSLVTGETVEALGCEDEREGVDHADHCGQAGRWWEPREGPVAEHPWNGVDARDALEDLLIDVFEDFDGEEIKSEPESVRRAWRRGRIAKIGRE